MEKDLRVLSPKSSSARIRNILSDLDPQKYLDPRTLIQGEKYQSKFIKKFCSQILIFDKKKRDLKKFLISTMIPQV